MNETPQKKASVGQSRTRWHALLVAGGIGLSRLAGFIRVSVFAFFFGNTDAADAFNAAFRIPNVLQNLFGEGVLSASFIPVYANLLARNDKEEARRVAGAIAAILMLITSILVLIGILITPWLIYVLAPGFTGEKREITIQLVRIFFPGAGLLVWSAWCLGILNSHGKFFLSYAAPVAWNAMLILAMVIFGWSSDPYDLAQWTAWGSVAGSALQILIQLPVVLRLLGRVQVSLNHRISEVRTVLRNFIPVFIGRGVVQISGYVDQILASLLTTGAVAGLSYAQILYTLPVSLFGMSVAAAELPAMSKAVGSDAEIAEQLRKRLDGGLRQIAFFVVPSAMAFLALGDMVVAPIFQRGKFTGGDTLYVWGILAGSSVGLLASTLGRLYSSTFYALRDTRTPLKYAIIRVTLAALSGYLLSQHAPGLIGIDERWGAAGITAASGFCGWAEFLLLRHSMNGRIGKTGLAFSYTAKLWLAAGAGVAAAWTVKIFTDGLHPILRSLIVLGPYGIIYFTAAFLLGVPEVRALGRFLPFLKRRL
ncbi:MAG TPA: murein biosynthesis integral membrane protein MurJ [Spirochaetota bacterium]|nr:murein biosynthesis integral membrane protein MurJ [Spirochaetota bacterium]HOD13191.1 murein biosynthesis integral membrane protein MurJ [Spirochaetota bacterium]HPG49002.1 murein biosynthesis integral membrane protein MurJ [Spirochaetota bacterium]HPN12675.1 murein biosynthesis integral membrane protein MurJ [Spirochaetota bacterium]HQL81464.1 murein biosynthesis integral membrane protein MurJ [Spirochaetota bacterium]